MINIKIFVKQAQLSLIVLLFCLANTMSFAASGKQIFIPVGVGDITIFIPPLPSPGSVNVVEQPQAIGESVHRISWQAVGNAAYYQINITDENGDISSVITTELEYTLSGLPLGSNRAELLACSAQDQCGASSNLGTFTIDEQIRYVVADILGSPILETDQAGNVVSEFHYKPYGETKEQKREDIGYTGHLEDPDLALTYMQARYYDPVLGRFYSNDPISFLGHMNTPNGMHGFNRYAYANNNPYKYIDPNGEASYLVSRPLDLTSKANHNFVVTNANSIGDPNATVHSWGNRGDGTMGRVDANTTGNSETTSATDRAAWENAGNAGSGTTYREINAPDAKVDGLAQGVVEGKDYDLVPALDIGGDAVNSNSAAGAVATAADGGSSSVNNGVAQFGAGQSDRVPIMKTFVPEEYK